MAKNIVETVMISFPFVMVGLATIGWRRTTRRNGR